MADTDQSLNNLRYNQVSGMLEAFGGGSPSWTPLTLTNTDPTQVPITRLINTTAPLTGGGNLSADRTLAIPAATNAVNGYLTAADHTTFSAKQPAGNYITALTGDVTAAGPGSVAASISDATVTGKLITGYVSGAGTVAATDTILQAINKLNGNTALKQNTISAVLSGASAGGAANEELTVAGLLTTSTIYAVTQSVPGANNLPMIGFTNDTNGSIKIFWTLDPGAGAQVVVAFI